MVMPNRTAIYARVSSEGDRQNTDRQVVDLQAYAAVAGLEVVIIKTPTNERINQTATSRVGTERIKDAGIR